MSTAWQLAGLWGPADYTDTAGNVITGTLAVYNDAAHTVPATLYTDQTKGTGAPNPVSADALGNFSFFATPGIYYGVFSHAGINNSTTHLVSPHPSDPALASALTVVAADSTLNVDNSVVGTAAIKANVGTTAGTVAAGDDARWGAINGIPVTGTPSTGWVPRASGASTAAWAQLTATDVGAMPSGSGLLAANNLSELTPTAGTVRTNLGLGGAAVLNVGTATGMVAAGDDSRFGKIIGATTVAVSGTPAAGQVPIASSTTAAAWGTVNALGPVVLTGPAATGNVIVATGTTSASWAAPSTAATSISGVAVSGTPSGSGQVLTSTGTAAANWQTPQAGNVIAGVTVSATLPTTGQVLAATGTTTAAWATPSANIVSGVTVSATLPTTGQVLTATGTNTANWQPVTATTLAGVTVAAPASSGLVLTTTSTSNATWQAVTATSLGGVSVSGTPTNGQVLTANSGTTAIWQNVTANSIGGVTVSGTPTNGQALIANSGSTAIWQNVTANSIGGVTVSGVPGNGQVLTANSGSTAIWATAPGSALQIATGLVADNGASAAVAAANTTYLQALLNSVATAGGGAVRIQYNAKDYAFGGTATSVGINVPDHVKIFGEGQQFGKTNTGFNSGGTCLCVGNSTTFAQGTDVKALITLGDHCGLHNLALKGFSTNNGSWTAPVTLYVSGCGSDIENVAIDGGEGLGLYTDGNSIDNSYFNVLLTQAANGGTFYYITSCTAATAVGDTTFQVAANTNIVPGMHVFTPGQNIGAIPSDAVVTKIVGTTITIRDRSGTGTAPNQVQGGLNGNINGKTLVFLGSATGLVACSDNMFFGLRSITGGFKNNGADSQFIGCHWSSAGQNHTHNLIHYSSQGATYDGNTFDTEHGADDGHVLRIYGDATFTGCRIQCGANSPGEPNGIPFIQDLGSDGLHGAQITGCLVPTVGSLPLTSMIAVSKYLFDSTTGTYIAVVGASGTPSGLDQIADLRIAQSAMATFTDPLGQVVPVLMQQTSSAVAPHSGAYLPFQGYVGPGMRIDSGGNRHQLRTSLPIASRFYQPHSLDNTAGFAYLPATGTNMAGFGVDPTDPTVFVPHMAGNYEVEFLIGCGSQNSVLQTMTFWVRWGLSDTTLTAATGVAAITSLSVAALPIAVPSGASLVVTSGTHSQTFTTAAAASAGATTVTIVSATPTFNFPSGSAVSVPPPANSAASAGTVANTNGYVVKPTAQNVNTLTFPIKAVIPITATQAGQKVWFDLAALSGGTNTVSIVPNFVALKGPYESYGF